MGGGMFDLLHRDRFQQCVYYNYRMLCVSVNMMVLIICITLMCVESVDYSMTGRIIYLWAMSFR